MLPDRDAFPRFTTVSATADIRCSFARMAQCAALGAPAEVSPQKIFALLRFNNQCIAIGPWPSAMRSCGVTNKKSDQCPLLLEAKSRSGSRSKLAGVSPTNDTETLPRVQVEERNSESVVVGCGDSQALFAFQAPESAA